MSDTVSETRITECEVCATKYKVHVARNEVSVTKREVPDARNEVSVTKCEVPATRNVVTGTKCKVPAARNEVSDTKCKVHVARKVSLTKREVHISECEVGASAIEHSEIFIAAQIRKSPKLGYRVGQLRGVTKRI